MPKLLHCRSLVSYITLFLFHAEVDGISPSDVFHTFFCLHASFVRMDLCKLLYAVSRVPR